MLKAGGKAAAGFALLGLAALIGADAAVAQDDLFRPRGRLQFDVLSSDWESQPDQGPHGFIRRAFLGGQGDLGAHWRYKADFVVTPNADAFVDDAYVERHDGAWSVLIGEHKLATPLEAQSSSLDLSFAESASYVGAFGYGRSAGVGVLFAGEDWSAAVALQGDTLNRIQGNEFNADARQLSVRVTRAQVLRRDAERLVLLHIGAHARARELGEARPYRYRARPLNGRDLRWIDAGASLGGESDAAYGVEAAAQFGRFGAQAEYVRLDGESVAGADFDFSGHYVDLFWSLTGESRNYRARTGSFGAIAPARPVNQGGGGHWMLAARYDALDLSDPAGGAARGEQTGHALGLDWVPIAHVRFSLNLAETDMDRALGPDETARIVTFRTQLDF